MKGLKERGFESPYLRAFVVARINPLRFQRGAKADVDETIETMLASARRFDAGGSGPTRWRARRGRRRSRHQGDVKPRRAPNGSGLRPRIGFTTEARKTRRLHGGSGW